MTQPKKIHVPKHTDGDGHAPHHTAGSRRKRRTKTTGSPLIAILVMAIVVGIVVATAIATSKKNRKEERRVALLLEAEQDKARGTLKQIEDVVEKTTKIDAPTVALRQRAERGVRVVLDEPLVRPKQARTRPKAKPTAQPTASAPMAKPPTTPDVPPARPRDEGVPVGILTRAELDARRRGETVRKPAPVATPSVAVAAPTAPTAATTSSTTTTSTPQIRTLTDNLVADTESVEANRTMAAQLLELARKETREIQAESRVDVAHKRAEALKVRLSTAEELYTETQAALDRAIKAADAIDAIREQHELAEAERMRREAEARKRKAYAALVARETALAQQEAAAADMAIAKNQFESALEAAEQKLPLFQSKEGKAIHEITVEQCRELVKLKELLARALEKAPMRWGWKQEPASRDIIGCDRESLYLTGKKVPWEKVTNAQLALIIKHYLSSPRSATSLQVNYGIPAALFYAKAGKQEEADYYMNRAIKLRPELRRRAQKLIETR